MLFRKEQENARNASRQLVLTFIIMVIVITAAANAVLALAWILGTGSMKFPHYFFATNTGLVLFYILGSWWLELASLKDGGESLARQAGGRSLDDPQSWEERRLRNIVMEVAIASGIKPPRVFILAQEDAINAFAAGWDTTDAVITVTKGAAERLTRDELQGVVAHEFGHIINGDMRLNMRLMGMVLGLQMLYNFGAMIMVTGDHRGKIPLKLLVGLAFMAVGWLGWLCGRILAASVSRQREFLADASAVQYTRLTTGIAGALRKIAYQENEGRSDFNVKAATLMAPMCLHFGQASKWFATHPPIYERLKRLGVSYKRFELMDELQKVGKDEYNPARLLPDGVMAPHLKMAAARWGGLNSSNVNQSAKRYESLQQPIAIPDAQVMASIQAELALEQKDLSITRIKAAILAYWVDADDQECAERWKACCKTWDTQVPYAMLMSVQNLLPCKREPIFESLVLRVQAESKESRDELYAYAAQLCSQQKDCALTTSAGLRLAVLKYWMGDFRESMSSIYASLPEIPDAVAIVSSYMAQLLSVRNPQSWVREVLYVVKIERQEYRSVFDEKDLAQAVAKVHDGVSLFAPMLIRAWLEVYKKEAPSGDEQKLQKAADIFWLMCSLLDTARPFELNQFFENRAARSNPCSL